MPKFIDDSGLDSDLASGLEVLLQYHEGQVRRIQNRRQVAERVARFGEHAAGGYSLGRVLNALGDDRLEKEAPFEAAISHEIERAVGRPPARGCVYLPTSGRRDLIAASDPQGGYLVDTTPVGDRIIGYANARSATLPLLERIPSRGDASIGKISGTATTTWLSSEGASITEGGLTFDILLGTPKTVGALVESSRQFILQTTGPAQRVIERTLGEALGAALDQAVLNGSGAGGVPTGFFQYAGVNSVSGTSLGWTGLLDALKATEDNNSPGQLERWLMGSDVARLLRARQVSTDGALIVQNETILGRPIVVSTNMPSASLLYGDFGQAALVEWGPIQLGLDPFGLQSERFKAGLIAIRAILSVDLLVFKANAFTKITSIT